MMDLKKLCATPDLVRTDVYCDERRSTFWFKGTAENIASFIINNRMAERITITDALDQLVVNTYGELLDTCPDYNLRSAILDHLIPMQMGKVAPLSVPYFTTEEMNQGYCVDEDVMCLYRHGEDDFSLWEVYLPSSLMRQVMDGKKVTYDSIEELFEQIPTEEDYPDSRIHVFVWNRNEVARYTARVSEDFFEQFSDMGCSVRGTMKDMMDELNAPEEQIDIMWDDLKPETQERLFRMLGDNGNFDVVPIATISAPEMEQSISMT